MNLLFVCSANRLRSPTAEAVFDAYDGVAAISAGTNNDAATPLSGDLIDWADIIFVMEPVHKRKVSRRYQRFLKHKKLVCLDIPDNYQFMQPELVKLLESKVPQHLRR